MSFTPPAPPWLRLPSHCYITPATAPLLTRNPGHQQNCVLRKWRQRTWRSKTSHYSSRRFSAGVCPDSDHQTRREIAWAWLHLIYLFFHRFLFLLIWERNVENRGGKTEGRGRRRDEWVQTAEPTEICSRGAVVELHRKWSCTWSKERKK